MLSAWLLSKFWLDPKACSLSWSPKRQGQEVSWKATILSLHLGVPYIPHNHPTALGKIWITHVSLLKLIIKNKPPNCIVWRIQFKQPISIQPSSSLLPCALREADSWVHLFTQYVFWPFLSHFHAQESNLDSCHLLHCTWSQEDMGQLVHVVLCWVPLQCTSNHGSVCRQNQSWRPRKEKPNCTKQAGKLTEAPLQVRWQEGLRKSEWAATPMQEESAALILTWEQVHYLCDLLDTYLNIPLCDRKVHHSCTKTSLQWGRWQPQKWPWFSHLRASQPGVLLSWTCVCRHFEIHFEQHFLGVMEKCSLWSMFSLGLMPVTDPRISPQ